MAVMPSDVLANPPNTDEDSSEVDNFNPLSQVFSQIENALSAIKSIVQPPAATGHCRQRSNNPHESGHFSGTISGEVTSTCAGRIRVPEMYFEAFLGKGNRDGSFRDVNPLNLGGLDNHIFHAYNVWKGAAVADANCEKKWYRTRGEGYVVYVAGGSEYHWATASRSEYNPCDL